MLHAHMIRNYKLETYSAHIFGNIYRMLESFLWQDGQDINEGLDTLH